MDRARGPQDLCYLSIPVQFDVAGGFRWFSTETVAKLTPGIAAGRSSTMDESWVDSVIGARARFAMSEKWAGTVYFGYGSFTSDSETWQALLTVDCAINDPWLLRGGYRYISVDHDINCTDFEFKQSGRIIGATYRF